MDSSAPEAYIALVSPITPLLLPTFFLSLSLVPMGCVLVLLLPLNLSFPSGARLRANFASPYRPLLPKRAPLHGLVRVGLLPPPMVNRKREKGEESGCYQAIGGKSSRSR